MYRVPKRRANIGLMPRVVARQTKEKKEGGEKEGEGGGKEGEGGEKIETTEVMDAAPAAQKMSNDDFRKLINKS